MFRKFDKHDILKNKVDNASSNKNHLIISSHLIYIIISEYKRWCNHHFSLKLFYLIFHMKTFSITQFVTEGFGAWISLVKVGWRCIQVHTFATQSRTNGDGHG